MKKKILVSILLLLGVAQISLLAMQDSDSDDDNKVQQQPKVDLKEKGKLTKEEELKRLDEQKKKVDEAIAAKKAAEKALEEKNKHSYDEDVDDVPCFVANIPAYVPSDEETDSSDSEQKDEEFEFSDGEFEEPPFKINYEKRGSVLPSFTIDSKVNDQEATVSTDSGIAKKLFEMMRRKGFTSNDQDQSVQQLKYLSMNIGLNRPRSLSSGKNKLIKKELTKVLSADPSVKCFGMFWDFPWERTEKAKNKSKGNYPLYEEVRSFYKQLKERDPDAARAFRRNNENDEVQGRRRMVPYRALRETVKNDKTTLEFIEKFRKTNPKNPIYLFFCDSDTVSFNGCLTTFTQIAKEASQKPDAMTTGYLFADDEELNPMIKFASELDMCVRNATAKHIPLGVYYPEPALCIMVPAETGMVYESFVVGKDDYETPQESPIILEQVKNRTNAHFAFVYKNPIIIKAPKRTSENKQKTKSGAKNKLQFSATLCSTGSFMCWSMGDLKNITENSAQSHARPINWAHNVLDAFGSCGGVTEIEILFDNNESIKKDGSALGSVKRNIIVSLLVRLFKSYDPISLAKENRTSFIKILKDYDKTIQNDVIPKQLNQKTKKPADLWEKIDGITSRKSLKKVLAQLLPKKEGADLVDKIDAAARDTGRAMRDLLVERLSLI